jgi:hypothetical protein
MRYELRRLDPSPGPDGRRTGRLVCQAANPAPTGPDRIAVAVYDGPLIGSAALGWEPAYVWGDDPGRWTMVGSE